MRIVSLLPAATEILCSLGLQDALVGVSHECDFPPDVKNLPKLTRSKLGSQLDSQQIDDEVKSFLGRGESLYSLDTQLLEELEPTMVFTQSLCEVCAINLNDVHSACTKLASNPQIIDLNPKTLSDVFSSVDLIGSVTKREAVAGILTTELSSRISRVQSNVPKSATSHPTRLLMLEWIMPPFSAGHWNPELIRLAGAKPVLAKPDTASRQINWEQIAAEEIDLVVCACCGFDAERTASDWNSVNNTESLAAKLQQEAAEIWALDGSQYFNRAGPRLVDSLELVAYLVNPQDQDKPSNFEQVAKKIEQL